MASSKREELRLVHRVLTPIFHVPTNDFYIQETDEQDSCFLTLGMRKSMEKLLMPTKWNYNIHIFADFALRFLKLYGFSDFFEIFFLKAIFFFKSIFY